MRLPVHILVFREFGASRLRLSKSSIGALYPIASSSDRWRRYEFIKIVASGKAAEKTAVGQIDTMTVTAFDEEQCPF